MICDKNELFYEPPVLYPEQKFEVDGIKVHFYYVTASLPHFSFYGDISEIGYRSDFVSSEWIDKLGVEGLARERIKRLRAEFHEKQEAILKKQKRKSIRSVKI